MFGLTSLSYEYVCPNLAGGISKDVGEQCRPKVVEEPVKFRTGMIDKFRTGMIDQ